MLKKSQLRTVYENLKLIKYSQISFVLHQSEKVYFFKPIQIIFKERKIKHILNLKHSTG